MSRLISICIPNLVGGGAERVNLNLAEQFKRSGHEVEFVLLKARGELLDQTEVQFPIHALNVKRFRQAVVPLAHYLRERTPNALLAAMWPLTGVAGAAIRLARGRTRLLASEHTDFRMAVSIRRGERLAMRHLGNWFYQPCHRVVAVSNGVAESLCEVARIPRSKIEVIHNPVQTDPNGLVGDQDLAAISGWLAGQIRLIAVGSLKKPKGFDVLLHALAKLRQRQDARLLILGEGPLRMELEQLSVELGISDDVWLPGFRPNPGAFLRHANVFVLSSNWEGFGNVIVEALSAGLPVVSTDCRSGPAEILENGKYGTLVPVGDPVALSNAIEKALAAPISSDILRRRAEDFAPEIAAAAYLRLLTE